jgi:hypothetical protein
MGEATGPVPFTSYMTTPAFLARERDVVRAFTRAVYRTQRWLARAEPAAIATTITSAFPATKPAILERAVGRYHRQGTWARDPVLRREGYDYLEEILLTGGFIDRRGTEDWSTPRSPGASWGDPGRPRRSGGAVALLDSPRRISLPGVMLPSARVVGLECLRCHRCSRCLRLRQVSLVPESACLNLTVRLDLSAQGAAGERCRRRSGVAVPAVMPVAAEHAVSLGEGGTPLVHPRGSGNASACRGSSPRTRARTRRGRTRTGSARSRSATRRPPARASSPSPPPAITGPPPPRTPRGPACPV